MRREDVEGGRVAGRGGGRRIGGGRRKRSEGRRDGWWGKGVKKYG